MDWPPGLTKWTDLWDWLVGLEWRTASACRGRREVLRDPRKERVQSKAGSSLQDRPRETSKREPRGLPGGVKGSGRVCAVGLVPG